MIHKGRLNRGYSPKMLSSIEMSLRRGVNRAKSKKQMYNDRPRPQLRDVSSLNIKCCDCGAAITELPFDPDPSRLNTLRCRNCMQNVKRNHGPRY